MLAQKKLPESGNQIKISDIAISDSLPPQESSAPISSVPVSPSLMAPTQGAPVQVIPAPITPAPVLPVLEQQAQVSPARRPITISDAVTIFLQQNLQLVAARYDIDTAEVEKLTARLRPNPQLSVSTSGLPLAFTGPLIKEQTYDYGISQTFELGGKRGKRMDAANANADLARDSFKLPSGN